MVGLRAFDTSGDALAALMRALAHLRDCLPPGERIAGFGTTGSAGELFRDIITRQAERTADYRSTEILAHYAWASYQYPNVGTVLDIGGNDAKIISVLENGLDFAMNDAPPAPAPSWRRSRGASTCRLPISPAWLSPRATLPG